MKRVLFMFCVMLVACGPKHSDPGFTSAAGKWKYTTPDNKLTVTFELVKSGTGLTIGNPTFVLNGNTYQSAAEVSGVSLPAMQKIRINANDIVAVFPYNIEFDNCTVTSDFRTIEVPAGSYTWPWGTTNPLTAITISRL